MRNAMWSVAAVLAVAACSSGGGGGPVGNGPPAVAGNYDVTFTATQATGCQGLITAPSSTSGTLVVTQAGASVTLQITSLHPALRSNPVGTITEGGAYHFNGIVLVADPDDPNSQTFNANGTFDGTFTGSSVNIGFNFTLATCNVVGTIVGTRS